MLIQALLYCTLSAVDVPPSILQAILRVESSSFVTETGHIEYVDRRNGADGEYGPYQISNIAFRQIYKGNRPRSDVKKDMVFATEVTTLYLRWLYTNYAKGNWNNAIQYYNAGPLNKSTAYLSKVKQHL